MMLSFLLAGLALSWNTTAAAGSTDVDYLRDVKPLLAKRCVACHGALKQKSGLRLDTAARAIAGAKRGRRSCPGNLEESLLIEAVTGTDGWRMPPEGEGAPLSSEEIGLLRAWIEAGAKAPPEVDPPDPRKHWAFRPPQRPEVPKVRGSAWVRQPDRRLPRRRPRGAWAAPEPAGR